MCARIYKKRVTNRRGFKSVCANKENRSSSPLRPSNYGLDAEKHSVVIAVRMNSVLFFRSFRSMAIEPIIVLIRINSGGVHRMSDRSVLHDSNKQDRYNETIIRRIFTLQTNHRRRSKSAGKNHPTQQHTSINFNLTINTFNNWPH